MLLKSLRLVAEGMVSFFSRLFSSFGKSAKLREVSAKLASVSSQPTSMGQLLSSYNNNNNAKYELFNLIESDNNLKKIMMKYSANRETLNHVYRSLDLCGAGRWARNHWVPASSLAFIPTLDFVLRHSDSSSTDVWMEVGHRLITYFEGNEVGVIRETYR